MAEGIKWQVYPMIKLAIPFTLGILLYKWYSDYLFPSIIAAILCLSIVFVLQLSDIFEYRIRKKINTVFLLFSFLFLGYIRSWLSQPDLPSNYFTHHLEPGIEAVAVVKEVPIFRSSYKTEIKVTKLCKGNGCKVVKGDALLYLSDKIELAKSLSPGDEIVIKSKFSDVKPTSNPHSYNFKQYLYHRGITHQCYVWKNEEIEKTGEKKLNPIIQSAMDSRAKCLKILEKYVKDKESQAIVSALILGYRNNVSQDVYSAFSDTGAIHILAVSGMHLTLLAEPLERITRKIGRKSGLLKLALFLFSIWFFTFLTGSGSAIVRAAVMLSLVQIAKETKRFYDIYNIIGGVVFLMLLFDPMQLFQAGFQFSVAAVFSLIFFQPIILNWYEPKNRLTMFLWKSTSVSLAAQILVVPLTIYFFHKLPVYFILSGFLPLILSDIAMKVGMVIILLETIGLSIINKLLGPALEICMKLFLKSVQWIRDLPYCSLDNLSLSNFEFAIFIVFLACIMYYTKQRSRLSLWSMALLPAALIGSFSFRMHTANTQSQAIVYDVNKSGRIDFFDGRTCYEYGYKELEEIQENFIFKNNRIEYFINKVLPLELAKDTLMKNIQQKQNILNFKGKVFLIFDGNYLYTLSQKVDYVLMVNNVKYQEYYPFYNGATYVFDKSFHLSNLREWENALDRKSIKYRLIKNEGAFEINIE